jgi:hypothetical protein
MSSRFDSIPNNAYFKTLDGEQFRKISAQVYIDPLTGIETYWDPMFDGKIVLPGSTLGEAGGDKFAIDPQTRVVTPNLRYYSAEQALTDLHASGYFDCEAADYKAIVATCLMWGKGRKKAKKQRPYSGRLA